LGRTYNEFLSEHIDSQEGPILDQEGNRLGTHRGVTHYTVGQRRGLGLSGGPFYVCAIDPQKNAVIVGHRNELGVTRVHATEARWIRKPRLGERILGQIRSRHQPAPAAVVALADNEFGVEFETPQAGVAPGQALVLALGDEILGGGTIAPTSEQ